MDRKSIDFARHWAKRYVREHRPYGLDESDVENMILRRLHYNKDRGGSAAGVRALPTLKEISFPVFICGWDFTILFAGDASTVFLQLCGFFQVGWLEPQTPRKRGL